MTSKQEIEIFPSVEELKKLPKDTKIYTILRHTSQSGLRRIVDLQFVNSAGEIQRILVKHPNFYKFSGKSADRMGYIVNGYGFDAGYELVSHLSRLVHTDPKKAQGYFWHQPI